MKFFERTQQITSNSFENLKKKYFKSKLTQNNVLLAKTKDDKVVNALTNQKLFEFYVLYKKDSCVEYLHTTKNFLTFLKLTNYQYVC